MDEIIICDSGISRDQLNYVDTYDIGYGIFDTNGHGSILIDLLHKLNKRLIIKSIKILDGNKEGTLNGLLAALDQCFTMDTRVVCLALSIDSSITTNTALEYAIGKLISKNKIIISALQNRATFSLPAGLSQVIGVQTCNLICNGYPFYNSSLKVQCKLPMDIFFYKSPSGNYVKFGGNSVACAFLSEFISEIVGNRPTISLPEIESHISNVSINDMNYIHLFDNPLNTAELSDFIITKGIEKANDLCNIDTSDNILISKFKSLDHLNTYLKILEDNDFSINRKTLLGKKDLATISSLTSYLCFQDT